MQSEDHLHVFHIKSNVSGMKKRLRMTNTQLSALVRSGRGREENVTGEVNTGVGRA